MRTPTTLLWFGCVGFVTVVNLQFLVVHCLTTIYTKHRIKTIRYRQIYSQMEDCTVARRTEKVVLLVGSCGMDRLLSVQTYPNPDAKVRTTSYHEVGGGNAANTASAMAFLSRAAFLGNHNIQVKLLSKIGDDYIGKQLRDELERAGVDLSSPLFRVGHQGSTTGFTSIIVSEKDHTRTCIHTPGTCGELTLDDVSSVAMDDIFRHVVHLHSDSRHTEAALVLAREARKRGVSVSVDAEKDRRVQALDELLEIANIIFTNSNQLNDYLGRLTAEFEEYHQRLPLNDPVITLEQGIPQNDFKEMKILADAILPNAFFTRWFDQHDKQVVITKGSMGAVHIQNCGIKKNRKDVSPINHLLLSRDCNLKEIKIEHVVAELVTSSDILLTESTYLIRKTGVVQNPCIVDTTGAGDAFIGGFLLVKLCERGLFQDWIQSALDFGSWVAGRKLEGPGARSALPTGSDVDNILGTSPDQVQSTLQSFLLPFRASNHK